MRFPGVGGHKNEFFVWDRETKAIYGFICEPNDSRYSKLQKNGREV
ncbi:hypothetical protein Ferp_0548 [Ferroglobus placidus DSM 10642]|uniref:Uncharacterized protein n=1 Tax=Ferroglobus placidus (strain DSM 10642 / AEDII12DO) TaxID=589924 RepID=D3S388_FERPA|nr:hypothetical protein Ferp_0548 [Ferroglobus placidus DSM 10642]